MSPRRPQGLPPSFRSRAPLGARRLGAPLLAARLVGGCALGGCGASNAGMLEGTTPAVVVQAPAPSTARYDTRSSADPVLGDSEAEAVERGILQAAQNHQVEMRGDGRLGLLAAWTAERLGEGGTAPPPEVVEFFARHLGLVEPVPHILILGQPDPAMLESGIADSVSQFLDRQRYNHYGAAIVPRQGLTLAVVTLSWRWVEMEPLPRRVERGSPIVLTGRLVGDHQNPTFAVARPDGTVERMAAGEGPDFQVRVPTPDEGVYRVELLADGPRGDTVIANFPIYVGVDVPESISLGATGGRSTSDASVVTEELLRLIDGSRRQAALPSLDPHDGLAGLAVAHSRDMVEHDYVGHSSSTTGSAADRVRARGYQTGLVLENIGRGYSAAEIHQGLLASPGHRANILNRDVTHVGIGVVAEAEGSRTAFVATQVFVRMTREIDVSNAPEELLRLINEARRARGAPPLEAEPNLMEAAQGASVEFFEDEGLSQQDVVDSASASLRRFSIAFRRVGGLMAVVSRVEEAARLEPTFDSEIRYVGIGVTQGTRADTEANAIAVVIVLAWPR